MKTDGFDFHIDLLPEMHRSQSAIKLIFFHPFNANDSENTSLAATMVSWCEGGMNQGILPITVSEEESNSFYACHLLNCDEAQGQ
jgi:hypothetical protein